VAAGPRRSRTSLGMNTKATRFLAVALVVTGVVSLLFGIKSRTARAHPLSVTFLGWSDTPVFPANVPAQLRMGFPKGEYALLGVTNNGTRSLRFDSRAVEYESDGRWIEVIPQQWSGLHGTWWDAGAPGSIVWLTRPSEVPRGARWRIRYVCALDVSRDVNVALRRRLNQIAAKALGTNTLAFCAPAVMVSPEIPPANAQRTKIALSGARRGCPVWRGA
jgi:hypothetical protein